MAPFTTDADVVIDPRELLEQPHIGDALEACGFVAGAQPGQWLKDGVRLDLMVPDAVAGPGRRGVRLGAHGKRAARRARGLEGALVDQDRRELASFHQGGRRIEMFVAGPAALLVSKLHKPSERLGDRDRLKDKDALDVLRLLRGVALASLAQGTQELLIDPRWQAVAREAVEQLRQLFGRPDAPGSRCAARAAEGLEPAETIGASCAALSHDLRTLLKA